MNEMLIMIFAILFSGLAAVAVLLIILQFVYRAKRRAFEESADAAPHETQLYADEVFLRVAGGRAEVVELPAQLPAEEEEPEEEFEEDFEEDFEEEPEEELEEVPEEEPEEEPEETPEETEQPGKNVDGVVIARTEKRTFAEKYNMLPEERRLLLDEFTAYLTGKEDCSKQLKVSSLTFKYRKGQIAKAAIRRDSIVLNFTIVNPEFGRMMRAGRKSALKVKPVQVRLNDRGDLEVAKQTADLTLSYLQGEEEYRSEKRKEARREAARLRREAAEEADRTPPPEEG